METNKKATKLFFFFDAVSKMLNVGIAGDFRNYAHLEKFMGVISKTSLFDRNTAHKHMIRLSDSTIKEKLKENILQLFPSNFCEINLKDPQIEKLIGRPEMLEPYMLEFVD